MGTKYPSQSASGYNASPPSDDGTAVSTNEVKWSFIKTKLADPIKTLADNINTALGTHFNEEVLDNTGALTTTAAHHKRTINQTNAGTISLGDAGTMAVGYIVTVKNSHTAANTVDLATGADTLDGTAAGSVSLDPDASMTFVTTAGADGYLKASMNIGDDLTIANDLAVTGALTVGGDAVIPVSIKYKTADTARNTTTTLADDPDLAGWTLDANSFYRIEGLLIVTEPGSTGTPDFKFAFQVSQTPQSSTHKYQSAQEGAVLGGNATAAVTTALFAEVDSQNTLITIEGMIETHASLSTTLDFQWAQNTSNANDVQVEAGSHMSVRKLV